MQQIKTGWTLFRLFIHLLSGIFLAAILANGSLHPDSRIARLFCWWNRRLCGLFHIQHHTHGQANNHPTLYVANHISWFDIPAIGASLPVRFLSKQEVSNWPLIGWLARKAGTLFIQRGRKGAAEQSIYDITHALQQGDNVIIFPEGTTTDGKTIKKFHGRLFQAAINANANVQAIAITYPDENGIHPDAPYIDDMSMMDSVNKFIHGKNMQVEIYFLQTYKSRDYDRNTLSELCAQEIAARVEQHHNKT